MRIPERLFSCGLDADLCSASACCNDFGYPLEIDRCGQTKSYFEIADCCQGDWKFNVNPTLIKDSKDGGASQKHALLVTIRFNVCEFNSFFYKVMDSFCPLIRGPEESITLVSEVGWPLTVVSNKVMINDFLNRSGYPTNHH